MCMYFLLQNQNLSYPIMDQEGQFPVGIFLATPACHGLQVCRAYLRGTRHHHSPSSHSTECFLNALEMAGRRPWEWNRGSIRDILSCNSNNSLV